MQVLLEDVVPRTIAAAPIAQEQNRGGLGLTRLAVSVPPIANGVAGELARIMTGANLNVADVVSHIIQAVGDGYSCCQ